MFIPLELFCFPIVIVQSAAFGSYPYICLLYTSKDYTEYTLDFDFSQKVKAPYPYPDGNGELGETSDEVLTNFFIMFSPNSEFTKFVLDDVKLELKK